jgi:hypothetical protein
MYIYSGFLLVMHVVVVVINFRVFFGLASRLRCIYSSFLILFMSETLLYYYISIFRYCIF